MGAVSTRYGIFKTVIRNQLLNAILWFLMNAMVFGWVVTGWKYGSVFIGLIATIFYMSGIYSYSYSQPQLDLIIKKQYDYKMPLKIGGCASLVIFGLSGTHFLLHLINETAALYFGIAARFLNFPFVYFFHGYNGESYNFSALVIISLIPIGVSYFAYWMAVKGHSLTKVHDDLVYEKREDKKED